jgi:hypothetical protein
MKFKSNKHSVLPVIAELSQKKLLDMMTIGFHRKDFNTTKFRSDQR